MGRFSEAMAAAEKGRDMAKAKGNKEQAEKAALMRDLFATRQPFQEPSTEIQWPKKAL